MKKTLFIKNAVILTVSGLLLRLAGIIFKVWLASLIGSEGIGLYQLIFSVHILAATFASSGICTAVTRLTSEELALGSEKSVVKILKRSVFLTLVIAFASLVLLFSFSDFIAVRLLGDARASAALKILPFSLPFMGISSCLKGYFIARRKATPGSASAIAEQAVRICLTVLLVGKFISKGLEICCAAVMTGDVFAEIIGFFVVYFIYKADKRKLSGLSGRRRLPYSAVKKIIGIALPITSGRYLNSLLRTAENLLVPKNLSKYKNVGKNALSQFGMIKGMALPILFFPSTLLNSVSTLLIPEMSEAMALGRKGLVKSAAENVLKLTGITSFLVGALFFAVGENVGILIYSDRNVGYLLKVLSPIVPFMYLDSISDGILKGLDQQRFCFRTSIADSVLRIIMVLSLLPVSGLKGFIGIMYFSNLLTCLLNVGRLIRVSGAKFKISEEILLPLFLAVSVSLISKKLFAFTGLSGNLVYIIFVTAVSCVSYFTVLLAFGSITKDEIRTVFKK